MKIKKKDCIIADAKNIILFTQIFYKKIYCINQFSEYQLLPLDSYNRMHIVNKKNLTYV